MEHIHAFKIIHILGFKPCSHHPHLTQRTDTSFTQHHHLHVNIHFINHISQIYLLLFIYIYKEKDSFYKECQYDHLYMVKQKRQLRFYIRELSFLYLFCGLRSKELPKYFNYQIFFQIKRSVVNSRIEK